MRDFRFGLVVVPMFSLPFCQQKWQCSQCKYIRSDRVSSLTGRAVKFLHRHNSESPVSEGVAGLLSAHFVLAGFLSPIHCAPHWGTMDREE